MIFTDNHKQVILVLGMHRSGTSAITRVLSLLGADLPSKLLLPRNDNPTGFWESKDLLEAHEDLLRSMGWTWDSIGKFNYTWFKSTGAELFKKRILHILDRDFCNSPLFIIKDPRICRFVPFWLEVIEEFGGTAKVIISVRNPLEVAASLKARDGFIPAKSLILWLRYVLEAERDTRSVFRSFVFYSALLQDWRKTVKNISERLGIAWPRTSQQTFVEIDQFLNPSQRHHIISEEDFQAWPDITDWIKDAYDAVLNIAEGSKTARAQRVLDTISKELDKASLTFEPLLIASQKELEATRFAAQEKKSELECAIRELEEAQTTSERTLAEKDQEFQKTNHERVYFQQQSYEQEAVIRRLQEQLEERSQTQEKLQAQYETIKRMLNSQIDEKEDLIRRLQEQLEERSQTQEKLQAQYETIKRMLNSNIEKRKSLSQQFQKQLQRQYNSLLAINHERVHFQHQCLEHESTINKLRTDLNDQKETCRKLQESRSWKVTKPLRTLSSFIRFSGSTLKRGFSDIVLLAKLFCQLPALLGIVLVKFLSAGARKMTNIPSYNNRNSSEWNSDHLKQRSCEVFHQSTDLINSSLPTISIIVLNYNGLRFLEDCFKSLMSVNYPQDKIEIIMVDNGSTDDSIAFIENRFPKVKIISLNANLGFTGGNNVGIRASEAEFVAILNNDTVVDKDWVMQLVRIAVLDPRIGIVASKILFKKDPTRINNAGSWMTSDGWSLDRGIFEIDQGRFDQIEEVFSACGASMLCRTAMLDEIGLFDENMFAYFEDVDLCWRAHLWNWKVIYCPTSVVFHEHSGTSKEWSAQFAYNVFRNRLFVSMKLGSISHIFRVVKSAIKEFLIALIAHFIVRRWRLRLPGGKTYLRLRVIIAFRLVAKIITIMKLRHHIKRNSINKKREIEKQFIKRLKIGIYDPYINTAGGQEKYLSVIADQVRSKHLVEFIAPVDANFHQIENRLGVDLRKVGFKKLDFNCSSKSKYLSRASQEFKLAILSRKYDVFINYVHGLPFPALSKRSVLCVSFPFEKFREVNKRSLKLLNTFYNLNLQTYDKILVYSNFTRQWTQKIWQVDTDELSPPILHGTENERKQINNKKNYIIHIGRFFSDIYHSKRQDVLIEAFKILCNTGLKGWELHLVGGCVPEHEPFLDNLMQASKDYSITFHVNCSFQERDELLKQSKIYWHATGYGTNEQENPEKQEHFGITTCEAMSMGCVPVVIRQGGQPDIVQHEHSGFLWTDLPELVSLTSKLVAEEPLRIEMAQKAVKRVRELEQEHQRQLSSLVHFIEGD